MIYIITALTAEARPLIEALQMKKKETYGRFRLYGNAERKITLVVTGPGCIPAAAAVGMLLGADCEDTEFIERKNKLPHKRDFLISFGCCAGISENNTSKNSTTVSGEGKKNQGNLYLGNKIINLDSQRTFYPDLLIQSSLPEAEILTGSRVLNSYGDAWEEINKISPDMQKTIYGIPAEKRTEMDRSPESSFAHEENILYDMESAAVYEAGSFFLGPHQMSFLRVVTDSGNGADVTAKDVEHCVRDVLPDLLEYIGTAENVLVPDRDWDTGGLQKTSEEDETGTEIADEEKLAADLCCSETMRHQLHQLLQYCRAAHIPWREKTVALYRKGSLPAENRGKGKKILQVLKEECLYIKPES